MATRPPPADQGGATEHPRRFEATEVCPPLHRRHTCDTDRGRKSKGTPQEARLGNRLDRRGLSPTDALQLTTRKVHASVRSPKSLRASRPSKGAQHPDYRSRPAQPGPRTKRWCSANVRPPGIRSLEQDADLIGLLYRQEYYDNPTSKETTIRARCQPRQGRVDHRQESKWSHRECGTHLP